MTEEENKEFFRASLVVEGIRKHCRKKEMHSSAIGDYSLDVDKRMVAARARELLTKRFRQHDSARIKLLFCEYKPSGIFTYKVFDERHVYLDMSGDLIQTGIPRISGAPCSL